VRDAAGPDVALRVDANGAWTVDEAVRAIEGLAAFGLELVEEPVHGVEPTREVRQRVDVPIAMDETASAFGAVGSGAADAVCLKVSACGGITELLARSGEARNAGSRVYLASTYDGPVGIAAAVHAAAAIGPDLACGLATLSAFAETDAPRLVASSGAIEVPRFAGLIGDLAG
jgi:L-alanine-DL-glutamate epimerase-like enolase superfamily enzyme